MTRKEKKQFLRDLISSVQKELIENVPDMPEEWDGHELQRLIKEKFEQRTGVGRMSRQRVRAYNSVVYEKNLI